MAASAVAALGAAAAAAVVAAAEGAEGAVQAAVLQGTDEDGDAQDAAAAERAEQRADGLLGLAFAALTDNQGGKLHVQIVSVMAVCRHFHAAWKAYDAPRGSNRCQYAISGQADADQGVARDCHRVEARWSAPAVT